MVKKILIGIGILAALIGSCLGYAYCDVRSEILPEVRKMLTALDRGQVETVYLRTHRAFKLKVSIESFRNIVETIRTKYGRFRGLGSIKGYHRQFGSNPEAMVKVLVRYEKGRALETFRFVKVDDQWRLLFWNVQEL